MRVLLVFLAMMVCVAGRGEVRDSVDVAMRFSSREYQHVRVRGTNPVPEGGLRLMLDSLREGFSYPLAGKYDAKFISDYGMRNGRPHTGIDLKAGLGDTIRSIFAGVVRMSKYYSGYGNIVVVRHWNGLETVYSHNSKNLVKPDDVVESGQPLSLAGRTGRASTEHLHFEVRADGEPFDPKLLVDPGTQQLCEGWLFVRNKGGRIIAARTEGDIDELLAAELAAAVADSVAVSEAKALSATAPESAKTTPDPVYHTIKKGEVLGAIARKYRTSITKLCTLNNLKSPDKIREGQKLKIK